MKRIVVNIFTFFLLASAALAQFTLVTGQVNDPNSLHYSYGTITPSLVVSGTPVVNGLPYSVPGTVGLDASGSFQMQLAANASITPAGSTWNFQVCSGAGTVPAAFGNGPVCFRVTGVTVSGSSQNISSTLNAAALALTTAVGFSPSTGYTWTAAQIFNSGLTFNGPTTFASATVPVFQQGLNLCLSGGANCAAITSDSSGNLDLAASGANSIFLNSPAQVKGYASSPGNAASGYCLPYFNTTSGVMAWVSSSGGNCGPVGSLPNQSGNQGNLLSTNGSTSSWIPSVYIDAVEQYAVDNTGGTDTTTALQNAFNACNGNSLYLRDGTYKLSSLTIPHACTLFSFNRGAHLLRNSSTTQGNQQAGWIAITSSNVRIAGLEIDGNNGSFTGNCVIVSGGYSYIKFLDNWVHNCDQAAWIGEGATQGGPSPSFVEMAGNIWDNTNGNSSGGPTAVGLISFRDASHDVDIHDNPLIDGTYYTYSGGATLQLESQGLTSSMYNFDIHDNPSIRCASDWSIQAGGFNSYELMSIRVVNNGFEAYQDCVGFVSIPVAVTGKIITGNHFNTHFKDLEIQGANGSCAASSNVFSVASGSPFSSIMTGRVLVVPCGASSALITAYVQYVSATSLNMCSNAIQPGGTCTALNASVAGSSLNWQLWGYSPTYSAIEGGQNQGTVIGNNVFYCETYSSFICINLDGNIGASVSGNTLQGFGEIGGVGIKLATYYQQQTISSISEVGNMVTATVATTPMTGNIQPGTFVCVSTTAPPCPANSGYQGRVQVLNQNYSRSAGTFSYMVPSTGLSCSSACGSAYFVVMNNVIADNTIYFPSLLPTSGNLFGMAININGATYPQDIFNNSFIGNKVIANDALAGSVVCFGITGAGAATAVDSTFLKNNDFTGCGTGIVQNIAATNTHLIKNACTACATIANISSGNISESDTPLPLADYAPCASGLWGNKGITSDGSSATYFVQPGTSGTEDVPIVCIKASNTWVAY